MFNFGKKGLMAVLLGSSLLVSACASTPVITTAEATNASQRHLVYSFYVRAGGNQQLATMIWDQHTNAYELKVASENETFIRAVVENLVSTGIPAIIGGVAGIRIAEEGTCGEGGNCGTIIWNDGTSSSIAASGSISEATAGASASVSG